ncbi:MAG: nickel pincer cofactor biosynthesis protein LarC [Proteobacteria bacterium]|nr:nickel pincer cofactor biosynthesis protein LarC [Pseudomonadota bacterium]
MKCLYFDCFSGISGDMTLGALLDLGVPQAYLKGELKKLAVSGYRLAVSRCKRMGISGYRVQVKTEGHGHSHRSYKTIETLIRKSTLRSGIKNTSLEIFYRIAQAEARIHQKKIADIHFHEVGAIDSIVDIVGSVICLDYLGATAFYSSPLPLGSGFVECEHGTFPVPAPAALELLKGVPVCASAIRGELVTPTGAAILTTMVQAFGHIPPMTVLKSGYGAGMKDFPQIPNMLRIILGETTMLPADDYVWIIEANVDDMNPEWAGFLMDRLLQAGALDVSFIPIHMKKNRPGILLQVISSEKDRPALLQIIFQESTTAGVRYYRAGRTKLERFQTAVKTKYGTLKVKVLSGAGVNSIAPEFEECKRVALQKGVPLKDVYAEVICAAKKEP